jgi:Na+/H+ antiporter NhaD/arsenite permease-like protein
MCVKGMAEKAGYRLGFVEYMKVAVPMTFVAILLCTLYIWVRYL